MSYKLHCGVFAVFRAVCTVFSTWLRDYPEDFRALNDPSCLLRLAPLLPTDTSGAEIKGRLLRITEELSEKTLLSGSLSGQAVCPFDKVFCTFVTDSACYLGYISLFVQPPVLPVTRTWICTLIFHFGWRNVTTWSSGVLKYRKKLQFPLK